MQQLAWSHTFGPMLIEQWNGIGAIHMKCSSWFETMHNGAVCNGAMHNWAMHNGAMHNGDMHMEQYLWSTTMDLELYSWDDAVGLELGILSYANADMFTELGIWNRALKRCNASWAKHIRCMIPNRIIWGLFLYWLRNKDAWKRG